MAELHTAIQKDPEQELLVASRFQAHQCDLSKDELRFVEEERAFHLREHRRTSTLKQRRNEELDACPDAPPKEVEDYIHTILSKLKPENPAAAVKPLRELSILTGKGDLHVFSVLFSHDIVGHLVPFFKSDAEPAIQLELTRCLSNLAMTADPSHLKMLAYSGVVPFLIQLSYSPNSPLKIECLWALSNLSADIKAHRDYIIECGAVASVLSVLGDYSAPLDEVTCAAWLLSNLTRSHTGNVVFDPLIEPCCHWLWYEDQKLTRSLLLSLNHLSQDCVRVGQLIIRASAERRLIHLCRHPKVNIRICSLRVIGNISSGENDDIQVLMSSGLLPLLSTILPYGSEKERVEALYIFSNLCAGLPHQAEAALNSGCLSWTIRFLEYGTPFSLLSQETPPSSPPLPPISAVSADSASDSSTNPSLSHPTVSSPADSNTTSTIPPTVSTSHFPLSPDIPESTSSSLGSTSPSPPTSSAQLSHPPTLPPSPSSPSFSWKKSAECGCAVKRECIQLLYSLVCRDHSFTQIVANSHIIPLLCWYLPLPSSARSTSYSSHPIFAYHVFVLVKLLKILLVLLHFGSLVSAQLRQTLTPSIHLLPPQERSELEFYSYNTCFLEFAHSDGLTRVQALSASPVAEIASISTRILNAFRKLIEEIQEDGVESQSRESRSVDSMSRTKDV